MHSILNKILPSILALITLCFFVVESQFINLTELISAPWQLYSHDPETPIMEGINNHFNFIFLIIISFAFFFYSKVISKTKNIRDFLYLHSIIIKTFLFWFFGCGFIYFLLAVRCMILFEFYLPMAVDFFVPTTSCMFSRNFCLIENHGVNTRLLSKFVFEPVGYKNVHPSEAMALLNGLKINLEEGNPNVFHTQLKTPPAYGYTNNPAAIGDRVTIERCQNRGVLSVVSIFEDKTSTLKVPHSPLEIRVYLERYTRAFLAMDYPHPEAYEAALRNYEILIEKFHSNGGENLTFNKFSDNPQETCLLEPVLRKKDDWSEAILISEVEQMVKDFSKGTDLVFPRCDKLSKPSCLNIGLGYAYVDNMHEHHPLIKDGREIVEAARVKMSGITGPKEADALLGRESSLEPVSPETNKRYKTAIRILKDGKLSSYER
jgi:hypothetical protein